MAALLETSMTSKLPATFASKLSGILKEYDPMALFALASTRKCGEPRDKVFAILGLLPPKLAEQIQPLYSLSVRDVYMKAFWATVQTTHRLGLLEWAASPESFSDGATWILDFRKSLFDRYSVEDASLASSCSAAQVTIQAPLQLHVRGILQGVSKLSAPHKQPIA